MATGGGVGGWEFYRVLVTGIPTKTNIDLLLRTRLQPLPGDIVNVHTQGTTNAVVTLQCQQGYSSNMPSKVHYLELGGSPLTIHKLGTESTTLVMENIPLDIAKKYFELAPAYNVAIQQLGTAFLLSGLIDNIYNLRSEVDAVMLWMNQKVPQSTASSSSLPAEGNAGGYTAHPPVSQVAPPPGIPPHIQRSMSQPLPSPATTSHVPSSAGSSSASAAVFNPLTPNSMAPDMTVPGSSHVPSLPPTNPDHDTSNTLPSSPTLTAPIVNYKVDGDKASGVKGGEKDISVADDKATDSGTTGPGSGSAHSGTKSPPPSGPVDTPPKEKTTLPREYTQLNPDALGLLKRLPEGDISGVEYNIREGSVRILLKGDCEAEEAISKFQDAYKAVIGRRLRAENVEIPAARTDEEVQAYVAKFEQAYVYCAFVLDEEKRQIRVISHSRQFEQAKQFLSDALQKPVASPANGVSEAAGDSMVITLADGRKLTLKRGDIVREKADVLVNAANGRLIHGGGVAGALNAASEGKLQKYCNKYMEYTQKGVEVPVGEVAVTHGGGNLNCRHVIHAVGPDGYQHSPAECERLVRVAIRNTLRAAEKRNANSIVLPALSCGIFGVSKELVARTIIDAIKGFHHSKPTPVLSDIRIVILDGPTHSWFTHYFQQTSKKTTKKDLAGQDQTGKHSKNGSEKQTNTGEVMLCEDDLPWIMTLLRPIAKKWKGLLHNLGVQNDHIMSMMDQSRDPRMLLRIGLIKCLKQTTCTLAGLAAALSSSEVGEKDIASEIVTVGLRKRSESSTSLQDISYPPLRQLGEAGASAATAGKGSGCENKGSSVDTASSADNDECPICLDKFKSPIKTVCGHLFCKECISKALEYDPYCPTCKRPLRAITGKQPLGGTMTVTELSCSLPGYEGCNAIQINYTIPSGVQGQEHPNPGQRYFGTSRVAYLPNNEEGKEVLQLLRQAFKARMIFTIGTSVTSGAQNVVVWNDIHHKTSIHGGQQQYGYPDPTYLQRVKEDLAAKGIVSDTV